MQWKLQPRVSHLVATSVQPTHSIHTYQVQDEMVVGIVFKAFGMSQQGLSPQPPSCEVGALITIPPLRYQPGEALLQNHHDYDQLSFTNRLAEQISNHLFTYLLTYLLTYYMKC